ncbi:MAG: hypothetical protein KAX26_04170, partial [Anaerolineae bacterium]|nr:hypothetical protein [Anaerolineae bacterium]
MDTLSNDGSDTLDLVGFDACLMAMIEVDNQLIPYVDVRVGSEETEPWDGWPYDTILSSLSGNPAMSASQLGTVIVDEYYASYGNDETQSAVDLHSPYSDLNSAVDDFAVALINGVGSHYTDIATARSNTQEFYYPTYIDLYDFAYQVNQYVSDGTINAAATDVMNAVNSAVIHEQHGAAWPGAHGISIYFPESEADYESHYDGSQGWLEFTANTQWDEWLHAFYSPPAPDIGVSPTSFEETVLQGEMVTKILTINNTGPASLKFSIHEQEGTTTTALRSWKLTVPQGDADIPPDGEEDDEAVSPVAPERRTVPMIALLADLTGVQILYDRAHGERSTGAYDTMIG